MLLAGVAKARGSEKKREAVAVFLIDTTIFESLAGRACGVSGEPACAWVFGECGEMAWRA